MNITYPEAESVLESSGDNYIWVVNNCPLCGQKHVHGGGRKQEDDPRSFLGYRASHCFNNSGNGYTLVEKKTALDLKCQK